MCDSHGILLSALSSSPHAFDSPTRLIDVMAWISVEDDLLRVASRDGIICGTLYVHERGR
jgi:hypothetical protein